MLYNCGLGIVCSTVLIPFVEEVLYKIPVLRSESFVELELC